MSEDRSSRPDHRRSRRRRPAVSAPPAAKRGPRQARQPNRTSSGVEAWVYGRHAVTAALANPERRWRRLVVLAGQEAEARALVASARAQQRGGDKIVQLVDHNGLTALLPAAAVHQGLALEVEPLAGRTLEDMLQHVGEAAGRAVIVVLDRPGDPHNVGAVLRSAAAFGALAVVIPGHGAPPIGGALAKAASGALESVPLVRVVNLARAIDRLKEAGFWICGLVETAPQPLAELDLGERIALVLGSEGSGMRRLVSARCDIVARLPTRPEQPTLNVSNAAAVALYELARGLASSDDAADHRLHGPNKVVSSATGR